MRRALASLLVTSLLTGVLFPLGSAQRLLHAADPIANESRHGMVVAAEPFAAAAGELMLERGGNAIDAAVAVGFTLAVTYPVAGNLGGGGFMIAQVKDSDGIDRRFALDFRETAPAAATADMFVKARAEGRTDASTFGALAAGIPGSVAGLLEALSQYGTLPREVVLGPAIGLAESGFPMTRRTADFLAAPRIRAQLERDPASKQLFYPEGEPIAEGANFRQPELARTLSAIAALGRDGFYRGEIALWTVDAVKRSGGIITLADLENYRPVMRIPMIFPFQGHTIITMPPPSSGGVCLKQILTMLERFPLAADGHNSSAALHVIAEAMRRSFADRNQFLGDPDFVTLPLGKLLAPEYLAKQSASIDRERVTPSSQVRDGVVPGGAASREKEETTHYSVVDRHGNAVSVTTTLNGAFGSKILVPGAGYLLNNEMDDFAAEPGKPNLYGLIQGEQNAVAPGKRPLSSMTPTIITDGQGRVRAVLGTPGGPTIITNVVQVILNLLVFGLEPQAAVNAPKIHHQHLPDRVQVEKEIPADVRAGLERRGHTVAERAWIGDFQLIVIDPETGIRKGASDPRGGGAAIGN